MRARRTLPWALLLSIAWLCPVARAQEPPAASAAAPTAADLSQLRSELADTRSELESCKQEIVQLRAQIQQVLAATGGSVRPGAGSEQDVYPTVTSIQQESQLPSGGAPPGANEDLLAAQVSQMEQTKVESASRYKVRLSGLLLANAFSNMGGVVDDQDLPNLSFHRRAGLASGNVGATFRQSILGLDLTGPEWLGARTSADVQFDFFGGFPHVNYGVAAGLVRLRTAHARLDWKHTSLIVAQDSPFFSPLSPTSYATLGEPPLSWAGNLWVWTPQIEVEHRWALSDSSNFHLQGGVMDPMTEEMPDFQFDRTPTPGEESRRPALAGHAGWSGSLLGRDASMGVGGYFSPQAYGAGRNLNAWAATGDYQLPLTHWLQWSGEVYRGNAVGGLGGGIWKSIVFDTTTAGAIHGLNDLGGWTQLKFIATPRLEFNAAAGGANPFARDLRFFATPVGEYTPPLARNQAAFINSIFRPRSNLLLALEYRHLRTYQLHGAKNSADHVNLAIGVSF